MALAEKLDRKQLKRPDEFQVVAGQAMQWMAARQRQVAIAGGAVIAIALAAWAVGGWRGSREAKAGAALSEALDLQSRPIAGEGPAQPGQETFPSKEERTKAALAALEKARSEHGGTTAATTALAEIGFLKLRSGDAAGAQKDLADFLGSAAKGHPLRPFGQESLGYAFEAQGKLDDARAAFEKLREVELPARADYHAARLALVQNKPDAKQQLERVAKEYPKDLEVVRAANERLELASLPPVQPGSTPGPVKPASAEKPAPAPAKKPQAKKKK
jgi:tetratricopeptide (TPR) repeat protein